MAVGPFDLYTAATGCIDAYLPGRCGFLGQWLFLHLRALRLLAAYDAAARGAKLYGPEPLQSGRGLLGLFELEKALYELRYELGNRPAWAGIPLQGILDWGASNK